jgi:hypothetical protein
MRQFLAFFDFDTFICPWGMKDRRNFRKPLNMQHIGYQTPKYNLLAFELDLQPRLSARSRPKSLSSRCWFHFAQKDTMAHNKSSKQKSFHLATNQTGIASVDKAQQQPNEAHNIEPTFIRHRPTQFQKNTIRSPPSTPPLP